MATAGRFCSVCNACGCGVALYDVGGKLYCGSHRPVIRSTSVVDSQTLTPQQKLNITNGQRQG